MQNEIRTETRTYTRFYYLDILTTSIVLWYCVPYMHWVTGILEYKGALAEHELSFASTKSCEGSSIQYQRLYEQFWNNTPSIGLTWSSEISTLPFSLIMTVINSFFLKSYFWFLGFPHTIRCVFDISSELCCLFSSFLLTPSLWSLTKKTYSDFFFFTMHVRGGNFVKRVCVYCDPSFFVSAYPIQSWHGFFKIFFFNNCGTGYVLREWVMGERGSIRLSKDRGTNIYRPPNILNKIFPMFRKKKPAQMIPNHLLGRLPYMGFNPYPRLKKARRWIIIIGR